MASFLKNLFGLSWFCEMFHMSYGTKGNKWYCKKCKITRDKRLDDNYCGPN